jgi:hypothetical protein
MIYSHLRNLLNHFQSAERWRSLTKDIARQNFDIHAFRAAFQMVSVIYFCVLFCFYTIEPLLCSSAVGT